MTESQAVQYQCTIMTTKQVDHKEASRGPTSGSDQYLHCPILCSPSIFDRHKYLITEIHYAPNVVRSYIHSFIFTSLRLPSSLANLHAPTTLSITRITIQHIKELQIHKESKSHQIYPQSSFIYTLPLPLQRRNGKMQPLQNANPSSALTQTTHPTLPAYHAK